MTNKSLQNKYVGWDIRLAVIRQGKKKMNIEIVDVIP
jgi:hypothetical protein